MIDWLIDWLTDDVFVFVHFQSIEQIKFRITNQPLAANFTWFFVSLFQPYTHRAFYDNVNSDHRNDVKMFKTQVAPQVQSFEHNDV